MPTPGKPLFQAATANLNPWTEAKVDANPDRGPLLLISGELDHTVPWAIVNASYKEQQDNPGVTEIEKIPGHGHAQVQVSPASVVAELNAVVRGPPLKRPTTMTPSASRSSGRWSVSTVPSCV